MTGAESIVRTLLASDVDICFANPGTSEMHFIAALDRVSGMRCVLALAEGVVTGAADGYFRVAGKPACTLLHLAPGFTNGASNLHNARKARSGIVNLVGQHASYHLQYDAPLTADLEGVVKPMTDWFKVTTSPSNAAADTAESVEQSRKAPGQVATLIVPADVSWSDAGVEPAKARTPAAPSAVDSASISMARDALMSDGRKVLMLGAGALRGDALRWAARIAAHTGCELMAPAQNAYLERGAGLPAVERLPHEVDAAVKALADTRHLVLAGAPEPVAFFAYPNKPSVLAPSGCRITTMADATHDVTAALEALARATGAVDVEPEVQQRVESAAPTGPITLDGLGAALARAIPANAIVVDESISSGRGFAAATAAANPHVWMNSMGASLGYALPVAIGAAIAAPGRRIIALVGDGSAMYTLQALWTMARENLDITIAVFANRTYNVLRGELRKMGLGDAGPTSQTLLSIGDPALDWIALSQGHGVPAERVQTLEAFDALLGEAVATPGPRLIEVTM